MIWYSCKQCQKTHGRPETAIGSMVFCECGQGNVVPWESTVAEPPALVVEPLPAVPALAPLKFEVEPLPEEEARARRERERPREEDRTRRGPRSRPKPRDPKFCLNHQGVSTHAACVDCGEGFCVDCLVYLQAKPVCGPCKNFRVRALHQPTPTSQLALVSLLLALFTGPLAFCLFPMGVNFGTHKLSLLALVPQLAAMALGIFALRATEKNTQLAGQSLAVTGILMGAFSAFWTVFLTLYAPRLWT